MQHPLKARFQHTVALIATVTLLLPPPTIALAQTPRTAAASTTAPQASPTQSWPRTVADAAEDITIYQPQIESWRGDILEARSAVSIQRPGSQAPTLGVIWMKARTSVDKESDLVSLDGIELTRANFPSDTANSNAYLTTLREHVPGGLRTISLSRLQASLAVSEAETDQTQAVRNEPPKIVYSETPALLVLIDGKPQLRQVAGSKLLRVINTPALILFDEAAGVYYLRALKTWWNAKAPEGPWAVAPQPPASLAGALKAAGTQVNLMDTPPVDIEAAVAGGAIPTLHVSLGPADLIQTAGHPEYLPIPDTQLLYIKNTSSHVVIDVASQENYVLISGRWFSSKSLSNGPWSFVAGDKLPADFAKIPDSHPKGAVLASVSGTVQAQDSLIDNQIPQTATVDRKKAKVSVRYDGKPELKPIEGTSLEYVANAAIPVIKAGSSYYAVQNGVWFVANSAAGPWAVATEVPAAIYAIPPSSPLHFVTYVRVYSSTPETVYVGYTPGYYGTVAAPGGVVVYGTGYVYPAWIGSAWYPAPLTYGYGTAFAWGAVSGFTLGAIAGAAWAGGAWGWGGGGGWGHNNVVINNFNTFNQFNFNHANIYNRWTNNSVHSRIDTRIANRGGLTPGQRANLGNARANLNAQGGLGERAGNLRLNDGNIRQNAGDIARNHPRANDHYAGRNGEVFRRGSNGWEQHQNGRWANAGGGEIRNLDREQIGRFHGERMENFRGGGGFAEAGGFRGGGGLHGGGFTGGGGFHGGGGFRGGGFHGGGGGFHGGFRR